MFIEPQELPVVLLTLGVGMCYTRYLLKMEQRSNLVELDDPLFRYIPHRDTSMSVFILLYTSMAVFFFNWDAWDNRRFCFSLIHMMITRSFVLWTHPFLGRRDMYPLVDPLIDKFMFGVDEPLLNDQSFSGHSAILCMFAWHIHAYRMLFLSLAFITSVCLVSSRVHYTADCFISVPFTYLAYMSAHNMVTIWNSVCGHGATIVVSVVLILVSKMIK
jgi:hypothetical protein